MWVFRWPTKGEEGIQYFLHILGEKQSKKRDISLLFLCVCLLLKAAKNLSLVKMTGNQRKFMLICQLCLQVIDFVVRKEKGYKIYF